MTDSDDSGSDPGDDESDYATAEEVATALGRLSPFELNKIELQARVLVRGTSMDPGEIVNTAVERLLSADDNRGRHWHRKETIAGCIYRTMKSIVRDHWRKQQIPMISISDRAAGLRADPDPEVQLAARDELLAVLRALGEDGNTASIALALARGDSQAEIKERFALTETDYDSALKRIRRRILKHKTCRGQA